MAITSDGFLSQLTNSFAEVLNMEKEGKLFSFSLYNDEKHITLNLKTGIFTIDTQDYKFLNLNEANYRLVYFRTRRMETDKNGKLGNPYTYRYGIGWQTTINGLNYQRILNIDTNNGLITIKEKR